jgi:hypothetical protein
MERFGAGLYYERHKELKHIGVNTVALTGTLIILGISLQGIARGFGFYQAAALRLQSSLRFSATRFSISICSSSISL